MTEKKFTLNTKVDYKTYKNFKEYCSQKGLTPSSVLRKIILDLIESKDKEICFMEELYRDYGEVANIFYFKNNVYVIGNIEFDDKIIQEAINKYMDSEKYSLINVFYAKEVDIVNIKKLSPKKKD